MERRVQVGPRIGDHLDLADVELGAGGVVGAGLFLLKKSQMSGVGKCSTVWLTSISIGLDPSGGDEGVQVAGDRIVLFVAEPVLEEAGQDETRLQLSADLIFKSVAELQRTPSRRRADV